MIKNHKERDEEHTCAKVGPSWVILLKYQVTGCREMGQIKRCSAECSSARHGKPRVKIAQAEVRARNKLHIDKEEIREPLNRSFTTERDNLDTTTAGAHPHASFGPDALVLQTS